MSEKKKTDSTRTTLRLDDELKTMLAVEAKNQNRSIHNLILTILKDYCKEHGLSSQARD